MSSFTLSEFNGMPHSEKIDLLEANGVHLEVHQLQGLVKIALFSLFNFYVEVYYNQKTDALEKLQAFDSYKHLDLYLNCIDLTSVYSVL